MKIFIIIFFVIINIVYSQNVWELNYYSWNEKAYSIEAITDSLIYVYSHSGTNYHKLYKSINKGKNWNQILETHQYSYPTNLKMIDNNILFLGFKEGFMFFTKDGGIEYDTIKINSLKTYDDFSMFNTEIGVITNAYIVPDTFFLLITNDRWKNYKRFSLQNDSNRLSYSHPNFKNDSIITCIVGNSRGKSGLYLGEFNINTFDYKLYWIGNGFSTMDLCKVNDNLYFTCGISNVINGGSGNDAIHKSTDGGKTWRRVLDLYYDNRFDENSRNAFGLQSIAFKDNMTGIAVGQFGKIVYTYDGGESWIYEAKLHDSITQPPTMLVRYAGSVPIIGTMGMEIYRMIEDNLAPKPEDTMTISGRVWEGNKGQQGIPVSIGYRVTMTDSNGYYKFTRLAKGKHIVKAINKYFDGPKHDIGYKPFDYTPVQYDLVLTSDTCGIDFNAIDLRTFYSVSGEIVTSGGEGLKDIPLTIGDSTTISTADGKFLFPKIEQKRTYELIPYSKEYKFTPWAYSINIDKDLDTFKFVATPITSVEENEEMMGSIEISPNPATDYITINLGSIGAGTNENNIWASPNASIEIYDVMGMKIQSTPFNLTPALSKGEGVRIDVSNLSPGVYFVKIGDKVEKFVKM